MSSAQAARDLVVMACSARKAEADWWFTTHNASWIRVSESPRPR